MQQAKKFYLSFWDGHKIILYHWGLICCLVVGLYSCGSAKIPGLKASNLNFGSNVTPIRDIKPDQSKQVVVYIQGKVEKRVPLVRKWAYQINDSTDTIWVITNQNNLKEGAEVVIKGKVQYQSIPLAGQELGEVYLEE